MTFSVETTRADARFRSAVTISLVSEARGGPFVFSDDLAAGCQKATDLGFDAVEVFAPSADALREAKLTRLLKDHRLRLAALGTGAGWVKHQLTLTDPDPTHRARARDFIRTMINAAGEHGAPAIIGSMQGRWGDRSKFETLSFLGDALAGLGDVAASFGVPLLFEPLNRYETNLVSTIADGVTLLRSLGTPNVKLLADLFHMNIEEADIAGAIRAGGSRIGHVHFADSNRHAIGFGHINVAPVAQALREISYDGYLSAEILPLPDSYSAARKTIESFRQFAGTGS